MSKGARIRAKRLAEQDAPEKAPRERRHGRAKPGDYWRRHARRKMASPGRSGAEKRRARKGGAYRGPGQGGTQGAARRLAKSLSERRVGIER
jgi:hypothetical protein